MDLEDYSGTLMDQKMKKLKMIVEFGWKEEERNGGAGGRS